MSNNCLITKLKGVVNNNNLSKLNTITIDVIPVESPSKSTRNLYVWNHPNSGENITITDITGNSCLVNVLSGQDPTDWTSDPRAVNQVTLTPGNAFVGVTLNKTAKIEISKKYKIKGFELGRGYICNLDELFLSNCDSHLLLLSTTCNGTAKSLINSLPSYMSGNATISDIKDIEGNIHPDIHKLYIGRDINGVNFTYCHNNFNLDEILEGKTTNLREFAVSGNNGVGDISVFLNDNNELTYPNLKILSIVSSNLTTPQEVITRLRELGVTVYI